MTATLLPMPAVEYHGLVGAISSSMIRDLIDSPRLFHAKYVSCSIQQKATDAMDLGTAAHCACLEPDRLGQVVIAIPREVLSSSGSRAGGAWKQWSQENFGKVQLKADDYAAVLKIRDAVYAHPLARKYLECAGHVEYAILHRDEATNLTCRARPDKLLTDYPIILDLKTSTETSESWFKRRFVDSQWTIQDAHYSDSVAALGRERPFFVWILAMTEPPYLPVRVFSVDDTMRLNGIRKRRAALEQIVARRESGDWSDNGEAELRIVSFSDWAYSQ